MNYSKFDNIKYDTDSDEENGKQNPNNASSNVSLPQKVAENQPNKIKMTGKSKEGRLKFEYEGRTIYEWEQSLDEVNLYFVPPPGITKKLLNINISHKHLIVGIVNTPPFIDEDIGGPIKVQESTWTIVDGEINITLAKMNKAETWTCALAGRDGIQEVDPVTKEELRKKMMLDRFQEEHPGFDFSGAEFNGMVPEAKDFMGGIQR